MSLDTIREALELALDLSSNSAANKRYECALATLSAIDPEVISLDLVASDFEDGTITIKIPSETYKTLGFAPCKIKVDLAPLVELGKKRSADILSKEASE